MTDLLKQYLYVDQTIGDPATPYLSAADFPGLICEPDSFINDDGRRVNFLYYSYPGSHDSRLVFFIHGIGPGHKAYLREIETLAGLGFTALHLLTRMWRAIFISRMMIFFLSTP